MTKLELINAELARLHTTYTQVIQATVGCDDVYFGQLDSLQCKMSSLYQIVEDISAISDDDDYYLMDDDDEEEN